MTIPQRSALPPLSAATADEPPPRDRGRDAATAALVVIATIVFMAAFTYLGPVLRPFLIAVFLFYAARFGAKMLARVGLGPAAAYASLLPCLAILAILFGRLVSREAGVFLAKWPQYEKRITLFLNSDGPARLLGAHRHPDAGAEGPHGLSAGEIFRVTSQSAVDYVFRHGLDVMETFVLVFVYLVFLFIGVRKLPRKIGRAFPAEEARRLSLIGEGIAESMEDFMAVKTIVGLGMGATAGLLMYLFGLDHWLLWAFLFFASNYVTYIGSAVTLGPPIVLAFFAFTSPAAATVLAITLVLNRMLWIDWIEVRLAGRELNLDPTLMFLWLSYWGWVWGVVGLVLAFPMMAALKIALQHVGTGAWAELLAGE